MSGKDDVEFDDEYVPEKSKLELAEEFVAADAVERIKASPAPSLRAAIEILEASAGKDQDVALALELLRDHAKPRNGKHELAFVSEDDREATFACVHCPATVAFVLPGLGEPCVVGKPGARRPPDDFMSGMDQCSTS